MPNKLLIVFYTETDANCLTNHIIVSYKLFILLFYFFFVLYFTEDATLLSNFLYSIKFFGLIKSNEI